MLRWTFSIKKNSSSFHTFYNRKGVIQLPFPSRNIRHWGKNLWGILKDLYKKNIPRHLSGLTANHVQILNNRNAQCSGNINAEVRRFQYKKSAWKWLTYELKATKTPIFVVWYKTPCGLVGHYQRFGGKNRLNFQGKITSPYHTA